MKPMRRKHYGLKTPAPETEALAGLGAVKIPPPARERMLAAAYEQAELMLQAEEERKMNPFYNLFAPKRWSARLAAGVAIALVMVACLTVTLVPRPQGGGYSLQPVQPALASQPGYLLAAFSSAEDEAAAQAEAEQLQQLAQELLAMKQGELVQLQAMLDELQAELEAKQALIAQQLDGQELSAADQEQLAQLEKELQAKAEQLTANSDRLLALAGLLSAKEQLVREQADVVKLNLEGLELPDNVQVKSAVEQDADGQYRIFLTLPNVSPEMAEELKQKLGGMPGLKQVQVDGVTIVTGVKDGETPELLRELQLDSNVNVTRKVVVVQGKPGEPVQAGEANVDVKNVDGQLVVKILGEGGEPLVLDGKVLKDSRAITVVQSGPEWAGAQELKLDELGKLYKVIVTGDDASKSVTITVPGEGGAQVIERLEGGLGELDGKLNTVDELLGRTDGAFEQLGAKLYLGELSAGPRVELRDGSCVIVEDTPDPFAGLVGDGYIDFADTPERLEELARQGYITRSDVQVITEDLGEGKLALKVITNGDEESARTIELNQLDDLSKLGELGEFSELGKLGELTPELQEQLAQATVLSRSVTLAAPGQNTLSITLDGDADSADGHAFGWLNDNELGSFVLMGEDGDELRAVELGEAKVYIGDEEAYQPELAQVRAYLAEHYPGQNAGFKATGKGGVLKVKVLLDGKVAEEFATARTADGSVVITHKG